MRRPFLLLCVGALAPLLSFAQALETVSGAITQNTTWTKSKTYLLTGFVYVKSGATLTIEPGTTIKGDKTSKGTLIVTRGAKIVADGKRSQPIVFTSNETNPAPGDWGGVVICGFAPTNTSTNGMQCLGVAEGGINTPTGDARYGSGDQPGGCGHADDNSGILRFVRIEYGGISFQLNNETNGLTLAGVGSGTTIDYVEVAHSGDDGFEFFGGTVQCKHLVSYGNKDDDFDFDLGYQGNIQFALAVRNPALSDVSGSNGIEVDNDNSGTPAIPKTRPNLSNFTVVGPMGAMSENYRRAAHLRRNSEPALFNTLFIGEFPVGLFVDGVATISNAQNGKVEVRNSYIADAPELLKTTDPMFNINQWFENANWSNEALVNSQPLALQSPFNLPNPNAQPLNNSVVNSAADFSADRANVPFFEKVAYIGAFSTMEDWTCGWAKFEDINTNCSVDAGDLPAAAPQIELWPTVAQRTVQIKATFERPTPLQIDIFALNGQALGTLYQSNINTGNLSETLEIGHLPDGMYFLRITTDYSITTERIFKTTSR
jgi:hypothetical protein